MTRDEALARMADAVDGELDAAEREDFERALAADPALAAEYAAAKAAQEALLGVGTVAPGAEEAPGTVVYAVQEALRARTGGRFYGDRFSRMTDAEQRRVTWRLVGLAALAATVAVGLWVLRG